MAGLFEAAAMAVSQGEGTRRTVRSNTHDAIRSHLKAVGRNSVAKAAYLTDSDVEDDDAYEEKGVVGMGGTGRSDSDNEGGGGEAAGARRLLMWLGTAARVLPAVVEALRARDAMTAALRAQGLSLAQCSVAVLARFTSWVRFESAVLRATGGNTPVHMAAAAGDVLACVELLTEKVRSACGVAVLVGDGRSCAW